MESRLKEDAGTANIYGLAARFSWPLSVVRRMTLEEYHGWLAWIRLEQQELKNV